MNRKNFCILLFLSVVAFLSAGGQHESMGDKTYNYDLEGFTEVHGSGSFRIEIQKGDDFSVMIIAEKSLQLTIFLLRTLVFLLDYRRT